MVFQNYALYPHFTVAENIGYSLKVAGLPKAKRQERILAVARSVGLQDFLDRKPSPAVGGPTAACGDGPGDDPRAEGLPVRRAAVEP